jgi:uncharacterized protein with HEPN domain
MLKNRTPSCVGLKSSVRRLAPDTQAQFPSLPFRAMRGMRNIIAHDYGEVDLELVWKTATADLPVLIETLERDFESSGPEAV